MRDLVRQAERAAAILQGHRATVVVAESSTGGLISAALLAVPGASSYFLGGAVVYTSPTRPWPACGRRRRPTPSSWRAPLGSASPLPGRWQRAAQPARPETAMA